MKHTQNTTNRAGYGAYSDRTDRYTSIPSFYIQQLIALKTPRDRVDAVICLFDCINGLKGNSMGGAMMCHSLKSTYNEDYLKLLLEEPEKHANRIKRLEKEKREDERENRRLRIEEERERKKEESLHRDFLKAIDKFSR